MDGLVSGQNKHPLLNEKNWSLNRLWTNGMIDIRNSNLSAVSEICSDIQSESLKCFGFDLHAPTPTDDYLTLIEVNDVVADKSDDGVGIIRHFDILTLFIQH